MSLASIELSIGLNMSVRVPVAGKAMDPVIFVGSANLTLAAAVAVRMGSTLGKRALTRFPDSELHIEVQESVRGRDVYLIQPTARPCMSISSIFSCLPTHAAALAPRV